MKNNQPFLGNNFPRTPDIDQEQIAAQKKQTTR